MVEEARAYRERVLGELSRRRDLARQQIDQLVHGRDRLVQAFERARLVAADVVAELAPLGELSEYVNLSPTTGPVPVMVPASRLGEISSISDDVLAARASSDPDDPALDPNGVGRHCGDRCPTRRARPRTRPVPTTSDVGVGIGVGRRRGAASRGVPADARRLGHRCDRAAVPRPARRHRRDRARVGSRGRRRRSTPRADRRGRRRRGRAPTRRASRSTTTRSTTTRSRPTTSTTCSPGCARQNEATDRRRPADGGAEAPATARHRSSVRDEALTPLIVSSGRKLKRVLADEQNDVLDRLRGKQAVRSIDDLLPAADEHAARYFDALAADLRAARRRRRRLGRDVGDAATLDEDDVVAVVRDALSRRSRRAAARPARSPASRPSTATTRSSPRRRGRSTASGRPSASTTSSTTCCATPTAAAPSPPLADGEPVRWVFDPAVGACSDCEDNSLQGAVAAGTAFPTGHVCAPAHAGCRCLVLPAD